MVYVFFYYLIIAIIQTMKSIKIPSYKKVHVQFDYYVVELISVSKKLKEVRFISKPRRPKNDVITFQYSYRKLSWKKEI
jgi:hypothetical protein